MAFYLLHNYMDFILFSSNNLNITKHIATVNLTEQKGKGIIKIEIFRFLYVILYFFDTRL